MSADGGFAPKVKILTQHETPASLETWKETLLFNLTIDGRFDMFLDDEVTWKSESVANRGLTADASGENRKTAEQKVVILNRLLGTIASYAPIISRQYITKEAQSLSQIWGRLRIFYGFRKSGGLILDLTSIQLEEGESHEAMWERLYAFLMDNLLSPSDELKHIDVKKPPREAMTPTLQNVAVVMWLRIIHPALPSMVKQRYSTQLRHRTLFTIREEISECIESMLAEITGDSANIARSFAGGRRRYNNAPTQKMPFRQKAYKFCPLCDANQRPSDHFLSECKFLPEADKKFMSRPRTRAVEAEEEEYDLEDDFQQFQIWKASKGERSSSADVRKVGIVSSPYLIVQYGPYSVAILVDSGAEISMMEEEFAHHIGATIYPTSTSARQADGASNLKIVGEVHLKFTLGNLELKFDALVAKSLTDNVIAGVPFLTAHDIYARPAKRTIHVGSQEFKYGTQNRSSTASIMRIPRQVALLPGDTLQLTVPNSMTKEREVSLEPRFDAPSLKQNKHSHIWLQPQILPITDGKVEVKNDTDEPVLIGRHEQLATIRPVVEVEECASVMSVDLECPAVPSISTDYLDVSIDPDKQLSSQQHQMFKSLHEDFKDVFDSRCLGRYNGASGPLEVVINMGPTLPPQRKGRMPLYNRNQKEEMQKICDDLEGTVLLKPEQVGITCEYLNPSFLVKKQSGKKRLVTAFGEVGQYSKPQPALMPDINSVIREIGNWIYVIKTDLTSAYWQMPLAKQSMKYCGVATPFKGIRVYGRGAMGMPGTETALEELLCRILGEQLAEGGVTKVADDLYCGGSTPEEAFNNWKRVLQALENNGLRLAASKTVICPKSVSILGWVWEGGTIRASPHKVSALAAVEPPSTIGKLKSYIGGVKFLSRVMRKYSDVLHPLEEMVAGKDKADKVHWSDSSLAVFKRSQEQLHDTKTNHSKQSRSVTNNN